MISEEEFNRKNARRIELLQKKHGVFSHEESMRRFDENPGWKEEAERRANASLTADEHEELQALQSETADFLKAMFPLRISPEPKDLL